MLGKRAIAMLSTVRAASDDLGADHRAGARGRRSCMTGHSAARASHDQAGPTRPAKVGV